MVHHDLPFHSQYWDLEQWKELGFESKSDARYWQYSSCGILCLGMVIQKISGKLIPLTELIAKGKSIDAYSHKHGWSHEGLVRLAKSYGLQANRQENLSSVDIEQLLKADNVVIISIKWAFEDTKSWREKLFFWKKKGGHLALVTGYDADSNNFIVHHTSVRPEFNWKDAHISRLSFEKGFTGRGIVLKLS